MVDVMHLIVCFRLIVVGVSLKSLCLAFVLRLPFTFELSGYVDCEC